MKITGVIALGIDANEVVTLAEADRPDVPMIQDVDAPRIYWDADLVDPELAQLVRFARACQDVGLYMEDAEDA